MAKDKVVRFRLLSKKTIKTMDGETEEVTYSSYRLPAIYFTRDVKGVAKRKVIHQFTTVDSRGNEIPVEQDQEFISGVIMLYEGKDDYVISALRESVNNANFKYRNNKDEAVFEEVDEVKERLGDVDIFDKIAEAYSLIVEADHQSVIEYASALGIDTSDYETLLATAGKKDAKKLKGYDLIIRELKSIAKNDPDNFIRKFSDPLRPCLSAIKKGVEYNVITFNGATEDYGWIMGNTHQSIIQVPKGIVDKEKWFATWLHSNEATYNELVTRVTAAQKV